MKIKFDAAFKNRRAVAAIVVGAIVIAIPIFIFGSIRALWSAVWDDFTSWAGLRKPVVLEKISRLAESSNRPPQVPPADN
ncbi:MAG: hypothetical protein WB685_06280 [Pseudolabrys sp.]